MKNDNFAYPYNDYREPDWQPGHHYPYPDGRHPMHPGHPWNDTEPAANIEPWCPPHPIDDCVCVTPADVDKWNSVSAISAVTGLNFDAIEELTELDIPLSAEYWNSTYETVNSHSAHWEYAEDIPEFSATTSAHFDTIEDYIYDLSAKMLNKVHVNGVYLDEDYAMELYNKTFVHNPNYPYALQGHGTIKSPLELNDHVADLLYYLEFGKAREKEQGINPGRDVVPKVPPFITSEVYDRWEANFTELQRMYNSNTSQLVELAGLVKSLLSLIQGGDGKIVWENKSVTIPDSKKNPDVFYYWSSK